MRSKVIMIFALFTLCSFRFQLDSTKTTDYYPLHVGQQWKYLLGNEWEKTITVTQYDQVHNAFILTVVQKIGDAAPLESEILLDKRNNGILELGSEGGLLNSDWTFFTKVVLKYPLEINQNWAQESKAFSEKFVVIGFQDVDVRAGHYSHVCKVKHTSKMKDKKGTTMVMFEYYAPNVGLIKKEIVTEGMPKTLQELIEFTE